MIALTVTARNLKMIFNRNNTLETDIELLKQRITIMEIDAEKFNKRFARKLTETIVFGACGAILMGFITTLISGNSILAIFGG